jgi:hypothetical protein
VINGNRVQAVSFAKDVAGRKTTAEPGSVIGRRHQSPH